MLIKALKDEQRDWANQVVTYVIPGATTKQENTKGRNFSKNKCSTKKNSNKDPLCVIFAFIGRFLV